MQENTIKSNYIAGVDEAGRGALAGPVVAASVILKNNCNNKDIKDSKKLSIKKRIEVFKYIIKNCEDYQVGIINNTEIDNINILKSSLKAMKIAITKLSIKPDLVMIDGNKAPELKNYTLKTIIKGDSKHKEISAASIIAKVTRDTIMENYAELFPNYGFEKHKGYGTKYHYLQLLKHGPSKIHRLKFKLKNEKYSS